MGNIILIGMMGCGKSVVGAQLAKQLEMEFVDMDEYIQEKYRMTIPEMFDIGEDFFRERETACLKDASEFEDTVISCGGGVVMRDENIGLLHGAGTVIYIDRPVDDIVQDVDCQSRPLLKNGPERLYELDVIRRPKYLKAADHRVSNDSSIDSTVDKIIDIIKKG